jgi:hypothetical protein
MSIAARDGLGRMTGISLAARAKCRATASASNPIIGPVTQSHCVRCKDQRGGAEGGGAPVSAGHPTVQAKKNRGADTTVFLCRDRLTLFSS